MTAALLDDLAAAGVHLSLAGDHLRYQTRPGVRIASHTERIQAHKPALLAELQFREQIVAAASVEPELFDRDRYDDLWRRWHAQDAKEESTP